eukprot:TRINITY_DN30468_c0_g1_i1.p1 TRINITY_DN30468_c0_g1~~TRINITY_DN30468_c0_g1_i1.p1  ORF type:complete len:271 (+),score=28.67 TRINITY_DN30468_c0_g1_i1:40-852(+)
MSPFSQPDDILNVLHEIRDLLCTALPEIGLSQEYPIEEASHELNMADCHGLTDIEYHWEGSNTTTSAMKVRRIAVGIYPPEVKRGPLPIELLIQTFIHELAHTVTHAELIPSPSGVMVVDHHSPVFYDNYATLLRAAEMARILTLPSVPNKFSKINLQRLDKTDVAMSMTGLNIGISPKYSREQPTARIELSSPKSVQNKVVVVDVASLSIKCLLQTAKQKLRLTAKTCRELHYVKAGTQLGEGTVVTSDSELRMLIRLNVGTDITLQIR